MKIYLYRRIVQAKLFMDAHFAEDIDLENIADEAICSKFHFLRLFKEAYGKTPHQYLIALRLDKAKLLLAEGNGVSEVCWAVGFESLSTFSGRFARTVGLSPSAYRLAQLQRKAAIAQQPLKYVPSCFAAANGWI
jgi:AraC-like DNA-binding protein